MAKKKAKKKFTPPQGPLEWIYVMDDGKNMKEIYDLLKDNCDYSVEYWQEAGVIEVAFEEAGGIDFEQSEEADVLWVSISPKAYDKAISSMKEMEKICGGKFTPDE